MSAKSDPRAEREHAAPRFYYRRSARGRDLMSAAGIAVAAGLVTFYVARIFLQRTLIAAGPPTRARPARGAPARTPRSNGG